MYLHLGQTTVVPFHDVIGVFDLDITSQSHITRAFLSQAEQNKNVVNVSEELPKAFVLCHSPVGGRGRTPGAGAGVPEPHSHRKKEKPLHRIYISQLSSATLLKRAENDSFE